MSKFVCILFRSKRFAIWFDLIDVVLYARLQLFGRASYCLLVVEDLLNPEG
jgi:hypothetical protein